ncbi:MAG TPA: TetR/AcrR family transcriptional regulator, partial [Deltaproteobacteria bacterium]|nr:TetR/AcrR family transcriptional regulator [Deltaproteobacteria bacterium]
MEEKRLSRKEREFLRHRQEILETALRLFSEKGFHNVSMQEIAQKAEFAVGTMYKFFENKEDLYKALVLEQSEKFHRALTEAIERPRDEIEKLRNYVRAKGEVFRANVRMIRL